MSWNSQHHLFGVSCEAVDIDSAEAVGAALDIGGKTVRPPISVARNALAAAQPGGAVMSAEAFNALRIIAPEATQSLSGRVTISQPVRALAYFRRASGPNGPTKFTRTA